jgi:hypothetical protein
MMIRRVAFLLSLLYLSVPARAYAQDDCLTRALGFDQWLNCRVDRVVAASAGPSGGEKQADAPSVADDSPTLVDASSAPDFVGFGVTLLGLRNAPADNSDVTSGGTSITVSAYSLLAAAYGRDPLADRNFYYDHPNWRRVSFTLGRQPARDDGVGVNGEATIAGLKVLLLDLREIAREDNLTQVHEAVGAAAVGFANIRSAVLETLRAALGAPDSTAVTFAVDSLGSSAFKATLAKVDAELAKKIDAAILARITAEVAMRDAIRAKILEVKRRPQVSLAWSSNLRDATAPNQHRFQGIVDYGMAPRLNLSANVGVDLLERKDLVLPPDTDTSVGRIAAALSLALADPGGGLSFKQPATLAISADLQWTNADRSYRTQLKLDFPVAGGIVIPVSLTWADRPELIDEKEVRGTFGFTIDTSKLASALR